MTGQPNVVVVLLDDVGFGAANTFGGPVDTPALDELAGQGLRYNRFHTTAICSPTRAALLTGRDAHSAGVGTVLNSAFDRPGYSGLLRRETATVATMLKDAGYSTAAFGKWHLTPPWESSQAGPFDRWPTGQGFEKFYGFLGGETDQYAPTLYDGTTPVAAPAEEDYHLTEDLADRAISWIRMQNTMTPERPFFCYFAPGATHAPLQVPGPWSEKYRGRFAAGWDAIREQILERQKRCGVVPEDTELTARPEEIPAWDSLDADERAVAERLMEVYAGFLEHTDVQIGRLVQALKDSGQFDNTLFVYIVGDNGSSAEGGPPGSASYMGVLQGIPEPASHLVDRLDEIGSPDSYAQYPAGWAWAMTTPFQWVKQIASHLGGTRNPMVVTWPSRISDSGGLRSQFSHVNDIAPTILQAAGLEMPTQVGGVEQVPMDGTSLLYSFDDADAPERHTTQYFEVFGHRSIYHRGWMASAHHGGVPWSVGRPSASRPFDEDVWELYHLDEDFSQARDLATEKSEMLRRMQKVFDDEAARVGILPLQDARVARATAPLPNLTRGRRSFTFYPGTVGVPESNAPRLVGRSWTAAASISAAEEEPPRGVIFSLGGRAAGMAFYLDDSGRPVFHMRTFDLAALTVVGSAAVGAGAQVVELDFDYDGDGFGRGAEVILGIDGNEVGRGRIEATPPVLFSIDETFDVGMSTGSPAGPFTPPYPFSGGELHRLTLELA